MVRVSGLEMSEKSPFWLLLPVFFSIVGGLIAYFFIKEDDPKLANYCIATGLIMLFATITILFWGLVSS